MLTLTRDAAEAIQHLTEERDTPGVRILADPAPAAGRAALQIELARAPDVEDTILEAGGARLYLEPVSMRVLDDKVLDAEEDGDELHFAIFRQPESP